MSLSSKIKQFVAGFHMAYWPSPEHKLIGKPINIKDDSVILFFGYSTDDELVAIEKLTAKAKKMLNLVSVAVFSESENIGTNDISDDIFRISLDDFSLVGRPKMRLQNWLSDNNYDILLSFANAECLFCNVLINTINSVFKVGKYNAHNVKQFDLTIVQESDDINKLLELTIHYLNNLNINK